MPMKKSHFTEEQVAYAPRQAETGTAVTEVCQAMGIGVLPENSAEMR